MRGIQKEGDVFTGYLVNYVWFIETNVLLCLCFKKVPLLCWAPVFCGNQNMHGNTLVTCLSVSEASVEFFAFHVHTGFGKHFVQ